MINDYSQPRNLAALAEEGVLSSGGTPKQVTESVFWFIVKGKAPASKKELFKINAVDSDSAAVKMRDRRKKDAASLCKDAYRVLRRCTPGENAFINDLNENQHPKYEELVLNPDRWTRDLTQFQFTEVVA